MGRYEKEIDEKVASEHSKRSNLLKITDLLSLPCQMLLDAIIKNMKKTGCQ